MHPCRNDIEIVVSRLKHTDKLLKRIAVLFPSVCGIDLYFDVQSFVDRLISSPDSLTYPVVCRVLFDIYLDDRVVVTSCVENNVASPEIHLLGEGILCVLSAALAVSGGSCRCTGGTA